MVLIRPSPGSYGLKEAERYFLLGLFFGRHGVPVPEVLYYERDTGILLVEDLGDRRLCDEPRACFYEQAATIAARLYELAKVAPENLSKLNPPYDETLVWNEEVRYFERWYVNRYRRKQWSQEALEAWRRFLEGSKELFSTSGFMHRDYQSKNLMLKDGRVRVVDFQGARIGPPHYDLASLLVDPYTSAPPAEPILVRFCGETGLDLEEVKALFFRACVFRLLQALAAFVKLSYYGKDWFKDYIPVAELRLKRLLLSREETRELYFTVFP